MTVADPTLATHAANKRYVDGVKQALDIKESVRAATAGGNLSTTYSSNVLTATANGALSIDGINNFNAGERIHQLKTKQQVLRTEFMLSLP